MAQTESLMLVALGFALALILVFAFGRSIWSVSNRFARRQRDKNLPASIINLQADRDRLRAENATIQSRLETVGETSKAKVATKEAELSRHRNRVIDISQHLHNKQQQLSAASGEADELRAQVMELQNDFEDQRKSSATLAQAVSSGQTELGQLKSELADARSQLAEAKSEMLRLAHSFETLKAAADSHAAEVRNELREMAVPPAQAPALASHQEAAFIAPPFAEFSTEPEERTIVAQTPEEKTMPPARPADRLRRARYNFDRSDTSRPASPATGEFPAALENDIASVIKEARRDLSERAVEISADERRPADGVISLAKRLRAMQTKSDEKISKRLK